MENNDIQELVGQLKSITHALYGNSGDAGSVYTRLAEMEKFARLGAAVVAKEPRCTVTGLQDGVWIIVRNKPLKMLDESYELKST